MGKHAAAGYGRLAREAGRVAGIVVLIGAAFFGVIWLLATYGPGWFDGSEEASSATSSSRPTTETTDTAVATVNPTTAATAPPTVPLVTTTTSVPPSTTTTTIPQERAEGDIVVLVLNSTGQQGLAATATQTLAGLGYQMLEPDNSSPSLSTTQVLFTPTFAAEAYTLAAQFPDGEVLENPSADPPADIVVILGTSYVP